MTEPQVWAAIGVLAAALVGVITLTTQLMMRTITVQFAGLRTEMALRFETVDRRFEQIDRRFEQMEKRFERLENQVDNLERDVQAITKRVFPEE